MEGEIAFQKGGATRASAAEAEAAAAFGAEAVRAAGRGGARAWVGA